MRVALIDKSAVWLCLISLLIHRDLDAGRGVNCKDREKT